MGVRAIVIALVALGMLTACTSASEPPATTTAHAHKSPAGVGTVFHELRARQEADERSYEGLAAHSLADLLPNQRFKIVGERHGPRPLTSGVVIGRVVSTRGGIGYYLKHPASEGGTPTSYDDPRSKWHTGIVTVSVEQGFGLRGAPKTVDFSVRIDADDPDAYLAGVRHLGTVLVALVAAGVPPRDAAPYQLMSEDLLADVDANGHLYFPALGDQNPEFLRGLDTVDEVVSEAAKDKPVIKAFYVKGSISY